MVLAMILAVMSLALATLWVFQRRLIYLPTQSPAPTADSVIPGGRNVVLATADELHLEAWYFRAGPPDAPAVLVASGNAGSRALRAPLARQLNRAGLSVLLFDYRGYAGNAGRPSEQGLANDVRAARRFLVEDAGVPPSRLVYFGESLGAAVVSELAAEHPPAGLVLRSPFADLAAVGRVHYPFLPVRTLLRDRYPVVDHVRRVTAPITVVYGSADSIVPPAQSRQVAAAARQLHRSIEVPGADHNDPVLLHGDAVVGAIVELARRSPAV